MARKIYVVIVSPADQHYFLVYAPDHRALCVPPTYGTKEVETHLQQRGFLVQHAGALKMGNGNVIECFTTNQKVSGNKNWKTTLEIANFATPDDTRVFLAALGSATRLDR